MGVIKQSLKENRKFVKEFMDCSDTTKLDKIRFQCMLLTTSAMLGVVNAVHKMSHCKRIRTR